MTDDRKYIYVKGKKRSMYRANYIKHISTIKLYKFRIANSLQKRGHLLLEFIVDFLILPLALYVEMIYNQ